MLQRHQKLEPNSSQSLPVSSDSTSTQIETYLDRLSPPVEGSLTEASRQDRRAEMKSHFEALIAAYIELGDNSEQALARAFQQFGDSRAVQKEWKRTNPSALRQSLRMACVLYGVNFLLFLLMMSSNLISRLGVAPFHLFLALWAIPAGFGTGFLARSHPIRSACTVQSLLSIMSLYFFVQWILWPKALEFVLDRGIQPSFVSIGSEILSGQDGLLHASGGIVLTGVCGVLVGSLSAGIGGWLRKQNLRQHKPFISQ